MDAQRTDQATPINTSGPGAIKQAFDRQQLVNNKINTLATEAEEKMIRLLIGYLPCREMQVGSVREIAAWTRNIVFEQLNKMQP